MWRNHVNVLVDTSVWVDFFKGKEMSELESALKECRVWTTYIVIAELLSGAESLYDEKELLKFLESLPIVDMSMKHWINVARLRKQNQKKGFVISTPDAHIAQATLDIKGMLFSKDKIFTKTKKITGIKVKEF